MSESRLRSLGIAVSLLGVALTAFLLYERSSRGPLLCATGGCETVQTSEYATVLGVPVALLGLGAYVALLVLFASRGPMVELSAVALCVAGVLFSSYLLVVQLVVLNAICDWCLVSDVLVTGLAALALLRLRRSTAEGT